MIDTRDIVIELLRDERDLDEVAALEAACFTNPWTRDMLAGELARNAFARVYIARVPGGRIAAFCACWIVADELHINTIAVASEYRRHRLASALMQHILSDAEADGAHRATLEVRRSNEPARRLYAQLGFVQTAVRPGYYTDPDEDALILWRESRSAGPVERP